MYRLKTTLVAMTRMRPWRTGWTVDRGVDFSLATAPRNLPVPGGGAVCGEPACFVDGDRVLPAGTTVVRTFDGTAAEMRTAAPAAPVAAETPGLRAWSALAGKTSGS